MKRRQFVLNSALGGLSVVAFPNLVSKNLLINFDLEEVSYSPGSEIWLSKEAGETYLNIVVYLGRAIKVLRPIGVRASKGIRKGIKWVKKIFKTRAIPSSGNAGVSIHASKLAKFIQNNKKDIVFNALAFGPLLAMKLNIAWKKNQTEKESKRRKEEFRDALYENQAEKNFKLLLHNDLGTIVDAAIFDMKGIEWRKRVFQPDEHHILENQSVYGLCLHETTNPVYYIINSPISGSFECLDHESLVFQ